MSNISLEEQNQALKKELEYLKADFFDYKIKHQGLMNASLHIKGIIKKKMEFEPLMDKIITEITKSIKCDSAAITIRKGDQWVINYSYGFKDDVIGVHISDINNPHAVLAIETKKAVFISDTYHDERVNCEYMKGWDIGSVIAVPLFTFEKVFGVVFFNYQNTHGFDNEIVKFIKIITSFINIALNNVVLNEKSQIEKEKNRVAKKIIKNQDDLLHLQTDMMNLTSEAMMVCSLDGNIILWNNGAKNIFGYSDEEAYGHNCHELLKMKSINKVRVDCHKSKFSQGEVEITCKDGKKLVVETSMMGVHDAKGKEKVLATCRDITERKMMEAEMKALLKKNKDILASIRDGFYVLDHDGNFTYVNQITAKDLGYETEELLNKNIWQEMPLLKNSIIETNYRKVMTEKKPVYFEYCGVLNKENYYETSVYPLDEGISVFWRDITDKKKIEAELNYNRELIETVIENLPDTLMIYDKSGNLLHLNSAGRRLFSQIERIETLAKFHSSFTLYQSKGNFIDLNKHPNYKISKHGIVNNIIINYKNDDKEYLLDTSAFPVYDNQKNIISYTIICNDITEKLLNMEMIKDQQDKMLQAEKEKNEVLRKAVELKDEFISIVSHELRMPITTITAAIQTMEQICGQELPDKAKWYLDIIRQSSYRQLRLVNNLLDIFRINAGHMKVNKSNIDIVALTRLITESVSVFAEGKNIRLEFTSAFEHHVMGIDEGKYERIILNLLSNAVKFTPENKTISVSISDVKERQKPMVSIQVKDQGMGIPKEKMELIFERFGQVDSSLTRNYEGAGLGLSIVKMFVELLGGEISLISEEGLGSTFTLLLPAEKVNNETPFKTADNKLNHEISIEFSEL